VQVEVVQVEGVKEVEEVEEAEEVEGAAAPTSSVEGSAPADAALKILGCSARELSAFVALLTARSSLWVLGLLPVCRSPLVTRHSPLLFLSSRAQSRDRGSIYPNPTRRDRRPINRPLSP
jgi:hypothetical protein